MTACHEPGNGGVTCIRQDDFDRLGTETRTNRTLIERLQQRTTDEFLGVFAAVSRVETKVDRLLEGLQIGQVSRAAMPSIDWELDEPTNVGQTPESSASIWAERAREAAERNERLQAELLAAQTAAAAATARFDERTRHSDRARSTSIVRWKLIVGLIATVLTSGTAAALIAQAFGG